MGLIFETPTHHSSDRYTVQKIIIQSIIFRFLGIVLFGFFYYMVVYIKCYLIGNPNVCYVSPEAWFQLPILGAIPAIIIQLISSLMIIFLKDKLNNKCLAYVFTHALFTFIFMRFWDLITGQDWRYFPSFDSDGILLIAGAIMGFMVYLGSNPSSKLERRFAVKK